MSLATLHVASPLGTWTVEGDRDGLTAIHMPGRRRQETGSPSPLVRAAQRQLTEYFAGRRQSFDLDLHLEGTEFQTRVWAALANIPFGTVATYGEVADSIGHHRAFRAVGTANSKNPFPIVVACHRVVAATGIGGYAGGVDIKRGLLALEGVYFDRSTN